MEQAVMTLAGVQPLEGLRGRGTSRAAPLVLTLEVSDPEVLAELRRRETSGKSDALPKAR